MSAPARPASSSPRCPRRSQAFTLIELLIVIVIIGLLTALLLPALSTAREHARKTRCASNMKQVALGMTLYWGDYGEQFPATIHDTYDLDRALWGQLVEPYVHGRAVFRCPALGPTTNEGVHYFNFFQFFLTVPFGYNRTYLGHPDKPIPMAKVKRPSETVLMMDTKNDFSEGGDLHSGWFEIYAPSEGILEPLAFRHSGGANAAFVDGRIKWTTPHSVSSNDDLWDLE